MAVAFQVIGIIVVCALLAIVISFYVPLWAILFARKMRSKADLFAEQLKLSASYPVGTRVSTPHGYGEVEEIVPTWWGTYKYKVNGKLYVPHKVQLDDAYIRSLEIRIKEEEDNNDVLLEEKFRLINASIDFLKEVGYDIYDGKYEPRTVNTEDVKKFGETVKYVMDNCVYDEIMEERRRGAAEVELH